MGTVRRRPNGSWEVRLSRKGVLAQAVYLTFETHEEAQSYSQRVEELLDRGCVPPELCGGRMELLGPLIDMYAMTQPLPDSDKALIMVLKKDVAATKISSLEYRWVENWVARMVDRDLAPSTLTKRVGLLARCVDWAMRSNRLSLPTNPLRLLPKGYASKGRATRTWHGERSRRLEPLEEGALRSVIADKNEALLLDMALETAMRLREMLTLKMVQVDIGKSTIFLEKTKNGSKRQVPMTSVLRKMMAEHAPCGEFVFPWWDGDVAVHKLENLSQRLSHWFAYRCKQAGIEDLRFHDLRHEATCRFYERTTLTDLEISKITGHRDPRMLSRYANLRASGLATKLW